jgi:hypothetical protein
LWFGWPIFLLVQPYVDLSQRRLWEIEVGLQALSQSLDIPSLDGQIKAGAPCPRRGKWITAGMIVVLEAAWTTEPVKDRKSLFNSSESPV